MRCLLFIVVIGIALLGSWAAYGAEVPPPVPAPTPASAEVSPAPAAATEAPAVSASASAGPMEDASIFKGDDPNSDGMQLGGWGSGGAVKSQEQRLEGAWSVKLTTQGLYSGGKIEFSQPPALLADGGDASRYIQFTFLFRETQIVNPAVGTEATYANIEPYLKPKASKMRFVFVSDTGSTVEVQEPTGPIDPDDGWMRLAVPLSKLKKGDIKDFKLKRLLIFTDLPCTGMNNSGQDTSLYLGAIKLVTDASPIKVDPIDPRTTQIMYPEDFTATADGGVSSLNYSWDFDDSNGIQAESTDRIAKTFYPKGGTYTVTLTVSDADGIKAPVTVTTKIEVTD